MSNTYETQINGICREAEDTYQKIIDILSCDGLYSSGEYKVHNIFSQIKEKYERSDFSKDDMMAITKLNVELYYMKDDLMYQIKEIEDEIN